MRIPSPFIAKVLCTGSQFVTRLIAQALRLHVFGKCWQYIADLLIEEVDVQAVMQKRQIEGCVVTYNRMSMIDNTADTDGNIFN